MVRLFVGLDIPEPLASDLAPARGGVEGAHWQRDNQLHLTLAFIGETPRRTMHEIESALAAIRFEPFELALKGVGLFGKPKQPKTLWAGVANKRPVQHLHEKIVAALDRIDVETERRKFKPHVTLARFRRGAQARIGDWLSDNERICTRPVLVDRFVLFSSERTSEGSFFRHEAEFHGHGHAMDEEAQADELHYAGWSALSVS